MNLFSYRPVLNCVDAVFWIGDDPPGDNSPETNPPADNTPEDTLRIGILILTDPRRGVLTLTLTLTLTDTRSGNYLKTDTNLYS